MCSKYGICALKYELCAPKYEICALNIKYVLFFIYYF